MKTMKYILPVLMLSVAAINGEAQEEFNVEIEPITISGTPGVHSFSWGKTTDENWVVIGGRIDGLHQRQPNSSFLETSNNKNVFIVDPVANQTWSADLSVLSASIYEQLQSTNQQFYQRGNTLYVIGGYGFSTTQADHVTYSNLTAIDLDGLETAVKNGNDIVPFFRQITDINMAVTGGQIGYLDSVFYLAGGQFFEGRYNPMGPNNGPGFIQDYTDEVREFKIQDDGTSMTIVDYSAANDSNNLHRRDYNMSPQIFPNGEEGFTMFSGVFDPNDLPFLNSVDVTASGYTVNNNFTQYLSQYHSAKVPIYDVANNAMHTLFFGGMSQYTLDNGGNLVQNDSVPFVKTISKVTRLSDGSMQEVKLNIEMPALLGSGAEFIPLNDTSLYMTQEVLGINDVPMSKTLIGYIVGGIESTLPNIFFINDGTQSSASSQVFGVYINKSTVGMHEQALTGENIYNLNMFPNPTTGVVSLSFFVPDNTPVSVEVYNVLGVLVESEAVAQIIGTRQIELNLNHLAAGEYVIRVKGQNSSSQKILIKQ